MLKSRAPAVPEKEREVGRGDMTTVDQRELSRAISCLLLRLVLIWRTRSPGGAASGYGSHGRPFRIRMTGMCAWLPVRLYPLQSAMITCLLRPPWKILPRSSRPSRWHLLLLYVMRVLYRLSFCFPECKGTGAPQLPHTPPRSRTPACVREMEAANPGLRKSIFTCQTLAQCRVMP
jgi:hypothetical protein